MAPSRSAGSFSVLIVDASVETRATYAVALTEAGFVVLQACDGLDALHSAATSRPDVIVTDVPIPRIDGVTLMSCLQADLRTAGIPVIVVTGSGDARTRARATSGGAAAFLLKPCLPDVIVSEVSRLMDVAHPSYPLAVARALEHTRLHECTTRLRQRHTALHRDRAPFDVLDHHEHLEALRKHRAALLTHKHRLRKTPPWPFDMRSRIPPRSA